MAGLILLRSSRIMVNFVTIAVLGPQGLALAAHVVADHGVGGVQNILGRAVVLLQTNGLCAGIDTLKVEDVLDGGTAEPVERSSEEGTKARSLEVEAAF